MPPRPRPIFPPALLCCLALLLLLPACAPALKTSAWVVRFDLDSPAKVASVCSGAKEAEVDQLLVQVRGRADALYHSEIAPRAENLAQAGPEFDPLADLLAQCAPLPLHAWLNVYYLWGGADPPDNPGHPGHPEQPWILTDNSGKAVSLYSSREKRLGWIEGTYADPASPQYRALFVEVVKELVERYPVGGIHLDFIRYPGPGYGKSDALASDFQRRLGFEPRLLPERLTAATIVAWLDESQPMADRVLTTAALIWNEFRAGQITRLLREVRQAAPGTVLSAAVFPEASAAYLENSQEWQAWAVEGLVDALYFMAYFGDSDRVRAQLREIAANTPRTPRVALWAGLGAADHSPEQLGEQAATAGQLGYEGAAIFSLGRLLKKYSAHAAIEAIRAPRRVETPEKADQTQPLAAAADTLVPPDVHTLESITRKALGGAAPPDNLKTRLVSRLREYHEAVAHAIPQTIKQLESGPLTLPERLELTGIFRYASPMDSPARWQEQEALCEKARARLLAGEDPALVAKEMSQDGTRTLGGRLAPRLLDLLNPEDRELAGLAVGETSTVMRVANGFWCYRLEARTPGAQSTFSAAPWEAKRILFRQALNKAMGQM